MSDELRTRVLQYFVAYDDWQTAFARARLQGWSGYPTSPPAGIADRYKAMQNAHHALRGAIGMLPLNYVTIAQQELEREADESRRKAAEETKDDPHRN